MVTEIDIRFLAQGRHGPMSSWAVGIGDPDDGVRVTLLDEGNDDRVVAEVLARSVPA